MTNRRTRHLLVGLALVLSFCSLAYELILGTKLSRVLGEGIFVYPACLAVFLLFMGLGSMRWGRKQSAHVDPWRALIRIEIALTLSGLVSIWLVDLCRALLPSSLFGPLAVGFVAVAWIGLLSGQELPILFAEAARVGMDQVVARRMILFDYLASLLASVGFTLVFFPVFGLLKTAWLVALVNAAALCVVIAASPSSAEPGVSNGRQQAGRGTVGWTAGLVALLVVVGVFGKEAEERILKAIYFPRGQVEILEHVNTRYQEVLLFLGRVDGKAVEVPVAEALKKPDEHLLWCMLNGMLQFVNILGARGDDYHHFLVEPALRFSPGVRRALILGGGDGLPARQLLAHSSIEHVSMVDLDGEWLGVTKTNPFMRLNTHDALHDPRLQLYAMDAFKWVAQSQETFDAILVDFPEELNLATIRAVSVQFMRDLARILSEHGVVVFQGNVPVDESVLPRIARTAEEAGLYLLFGRQTAPVEPYEFLATQFLVFKSNEARQDFLQTYVTRFLASPRHYEQQKVFGRIEYKLVLSGEEWISVYDPKLLMDLLLHLVRLGTAG